MGNKKGMQEQQLKDELRKARRLAALWKKAFKVIHRGTEYSEERSHQLRQILGLIVKEGGNL